MFNIGAPELLVIVVVAVLVIGPKDMPAALRLAGRWVGKLRRTSAQFRTGFDAMVREAEMEDMEKKWAEQNRKIMAETPAGETDADAGSDVEMLPLQNPKSEAPVDDAAEAMAAAKSQHGKP